MSEPELIGLLAMEGQKDSSGRFTLEAEEALTKMRARLLQPEDCLLYLLQSAVASGASFVELTCGQSEVAFCHDGFFPELSDCPDILNWALGGAAVAQHRLGMALAASLSPGGQGMRLELPSGAIVRIEIGGRRASLHYSSAEPRREGRICIPMRVSWWKKIWGNTSTSVLVQRLAEKGRFAPLLLTINQVCANVSGKPAYADHKWSDTINWGDGLPTYYLDHHYLEMRSKPLKRPPSLASLEVYRPLPKSGPSWAMAGAKIRSREWAFLEVIQYGVCLAPVKAKGLQDPGFWLADDSLETDPSLLRVIENEQLTAWRAVLEKWWEPIHLVLQQQFEQALQEQRPHGLAFWVVENREKLKRLLAEYMYPGGRSRADL